MKKLYFLIITLIIFFPNNIKAIEINDIDIVGKKQISIGEQFTESILISFDDLEQSFEQKDGLVYIKYEIIFDSELFSIISHESPDWDTYIYQEEDKYYVLSIVNNENKLKQNCPNSFLYCGEYQNTIEFFLNKTTLTKTNITIANIELAYLGVYESTQLPTIDELTTIESNYEKTYELTINNIEEIEIPKKENVLEELTYNDIEEKIANALLLKPIKSEITSNLLKNIEIDNYPIKFDKHQNNYEITISEFITKLDIEAIPEDPNATYEIIGNEKLTDNSQITIAVKSKSNEINNYIININVLEDSNDKEILTSTKTSINFSNLYTKYKVYIIPITIAIGFILLLVIITKIVSKIKDKKIEDMTNKF